MVSKLGESNGFEIPYERDKVKKYHKIMHAKARAKSRILEHAYVKTKAFERKSCILKHVPRHI